MRLIGSTEEQWEGWLGSHRWQEVLEGYFRCWGVLPEKCGVWTPSWAPQSRARKEIRQHLPVERSTVSVSQGETAGNSESPLKDQCTKFHLQPLTLSFGTGKKSRLETLGETLRLVALGRELNEQPPWTLCWVILILQEPSFAGRGLLSKWHQSKGKMQLLCPTMWSSDSAADYRMSYISD